MLSHEALLFGSSIALHLLFSILILIEGAIRTTDSAALGHTNDVISGGGWTGGPDEFPPVILLLGGVSECVFGMCGVIYSMSGIMSLPTVKGTKFVIMVEVILGWFTFIIYVIANPAYTAHHNTNTIINYSNSEEDSITVLGIIASVGYCASLQGAQVYFANNILSLIQKDETRFHHEATKGRMIYYSVLYLFGTVCQLAIGCYVYSHPTPQFVISPPFVIVYPQIAIAVGCVSTAAALFSLARSLVSAARMDESEIGHTLFDLMVLVSWGLNMSLSILTQISLVAPPTYMVFASAQVTLLIFALHFMPIYLDTQLRPTTTQMLQQGEKEGE
jgi:hypothetical protein